MKPFINWRMPKNKLHLLYFTLCERNCTKLKLDDVFERKDEIADVVKNELTGVMDQFGYGIMTSLVTQLIQIPKLKSHMNKSMQLPEKE